jgi:hypothetical protein
MGTRRDGHSPIGRNAGKGGGSTVINILSIPRDVQNILAHDKTPTMPKVFFNARGYGIKVACKRCGEPRRPSALTEEGVCRSVFMCNRFKTAEGAANVISPSRHGVRGVKVSPVVIEQARQLIEGGMSYRQVGDKLGVAPQTLYVYIPVPGGTGRRRATGKSGPVIKIMPPAAEEFVSLRQGIMDVLIEKEKVGTVAVLVDYLRQRPNIGPVDLHNVTHLLYTMTKQEQVTFTTTRNGHDVFPMRLAARSSSNRLQAREGRRGRPECPGNPSGGSSSRPLDDRMAGRRVWAYRTPASDLVHQDVSGEPLGPPSHPRPTPKPRALTQGCYRQGRGGDLNPAHGGPANRRARYRYALPHGERAAVHARRGRIPRVCLCPPRVGRRDNLSRG